MVASPSAVRPVRSMMDSALRGWRSMAASAALGPVGSAVAAIGMARTGDEDPVADPQYAGLLQRR